MLLAHTRLITAPVMSLQTGAELAHVNSLLIDPRDLTIAAYVLDGQSLDVRPSYLRPADVREISTIGLIVDSSDEFILADDVIKIKQVIDFEFTLIGIDVVDDKRHKLGKVHGYSIDGESFCIQQLMVKRPLLKSFNETELIIHRSQVLEVSDERILVKSTADRQTAVQTIKEYANPFRSSSTQPESIER